MRASLPQSKGDLASILEAVELYQNSKSENPAVQAALFDQIYAATSLTTEEAKRFSSADSGSDDATVDWLSAIDAASLDAHSAYLLAAVAVERGEVPSSDIPTHSAKLLDLAVSDARSELLRSSPRATHSRFDSATEEPESSPDLPTASAFFCNSADKAITQVLDISEHTVNAFVESVSKHAGDLLAAFESIPQLSSIGDGMSGFVALACAKIRSALAFLRGLMKPLAEDQMKMLLKQFQSGLSVRSVLGAVYHIETLRKDTSRLHFRSNVTVAEVDTASTQLKKLMKQFDKFMSNLRAVCAGLVLVVSIIVAHLAAPLVPLIVPAVNSLITLVAIASGLSCLGQMQILKNVRGIRLIEEGLKSPDAI